MWFSALFSIVASGALLALSVFPGILEQVPDQSARFVGGVLALLIGPPALWELVRPARSDRPRRRVTALVVLAALVLTPTLLLTNVPRRLVFDAYRPHFEALLAEAPPAGDHSTVNLNADLRLFWIDEWGTDRRGGTYFRTMVGAAPDRRSYGFAHRPNAEGSPFGDVGYELRHLAGDWYSFRANDR